MTLKECKENIGKRVTYIPFKNCDKSLYERGIIKSVNSKYAFVLYDTTFGTKATNPKNLTLCV